MKEFVRFQEVRFLLFIGDVIKNFILLSGLEYVIEVRDRTDEAIAEATTSANQQCMDTATATWPFYLETVGGEFSSCGNIHIGPIFELTQGLHNYIQEQNRVAFNTQNIVLNVFSEVCDAKF